MLYLLMKEVVEMEVEIDFKVIGQRIKEARKLKGLSQDKLSEEIDVSPAYISRIERGTSEVSLKRLVQIAKALNCSVEYLVGGTIPKANNYLNRDLYETLSNCSPSKQRLVYNIAQIVSHTKFV